MDPNNLGIGKLMQVSILTPNIDETTENFAKFFNLPKPENSGKGDFSITQTQYKGMPAPHAKSKLAFFNFEGIQLEFIEPFDGDSVWQDYINETGGQGGIHHLGFQVEDMDEALEKCKEMGMELVQTGIYRSGNGMYAYLDARKQLKCFVELLYNFKK